MITKDRDISQTPLCFVKRVGFCNGDIGAERTVCCDRGGTVTWVIAEGADRVWIVLHCDLRLFRSSERKECEKVLDGQEYITGSPAEPEECGSQIAGTCGRTQSRGLDYQLTPFSGTPFSCVLTRLQFTMTNAVGK